MAKKKDRIVPTLEGEKQQEHPENVAPMIAPVEMQFNVAGANVQKYETPNGTLTVLSLVSPIGISVSVQLSDDNVEALVKDLVGEKEEKSIVDIYKTLPPGSVYLNDKD